MAVRPILPLSSLLQLFPQVLLPGEKNLQASTLRNMMQNTDGRLLTKGWLEVELREVICTSFSIFFLSSSSFARASLWVKIGPNQWSKIRFNKDIEEGLKQYVPSYNLIKKNSWCNYHIGLDCSQPQALSRSVELFPLLQPPTQFYLFWLNLSSASH